MKIQSLLALVLLAGSMSGAELWKFAPETVKPDKNTLISPAGEGFKISANARIYSSSTITIDPAQQYKISFLTRKVSGDPKVWVLMDSLTEQDKLIYPASALTVSDELGTLAAPVKRGDTVIKITGADKWIALKGSKILAFNAKADKSDLPNLELSPRIKSISPDGSVVLARPVRRSYPVGTQVRCHRETPQFTSLMRVAPPESWKYFDTKISGVSTGIERGKFPVGTKKIRFRVYTDGEVEIKDLKMTDSGSAKTASPEKKTLNFGKNARPELVLQAKNGKIDTAYLSWWGEPDDDVTLRLQDAVNSKIKKLVIDKFPAPWITEPVYLRSDLEVIFADGAVLMAKKGAFQSGNDSLLNVESARNVIIRGEGKTGGTVQMHKRDYQNRELYSKSEHRHGIVVRGGKNILIENMRSVSSGGDGIIVTHKNADFPRNITIRKVDCDDNHRQGLSIICGYDILVEDSIFRNTSGTNPEAGIDVESNKNDDPVSNITIRNCKMVDNAGFGLIISTTRMDSNRSGALSVSVEKCRMTDNLKGDFGMATRSRWLRPGEDTWGNVIFKDCVFENIKHKSHRRYPIDMEFDVRHKVNVTFENLTLKRGPAPQRAIRIAHCMPEKDFQVPGSKVIFKNLNNMDVPADELLQFADHTFSGAADLVSGIPFVPVKHPEIAPVKYTPVSSVKYLYPETYQVLRANYWLDCRAGAAAGFTLKYASLGRRSRGTVVTLISPDGKEQNLGSMFPGKEYKYSFVPEQTGFYHVAVRGGLQPKITLKESTVPAGILADPVDTIMFDPGVLYFRVPEKAKPFAVRIWGRSNALTVKAEIFDPQGKLVFADDAVNAGVQYTPTDAELSRAGVWKLVLSKGRGYFAKYHVAFPGLSPYLGASPECVPDVK